MKESKLYIFEVCGTSYSDKKKCLNCENSHKKPIKIDSCRYLAFQNNKQGYPLQINV